MSILSMCAKFVHLHCLSDCTDNVVDVIAHLHHLLQPSTFLAQLISFQSLFGYEERVLCFHAYVILLQPFEGRKIVAIWGGKIVAIWGQGDCSCLGAGKL